VEHDYVERCVGVVTTCRKDASSVYMDYWGDLISCVSFNVNGRISAFQLI
jgi:hypothetical protein